MLEQIARERVLLRQIREKCSKTSQPGVSIIIATAKFKYIDNIFSNYLKLTYPNTELIIILNKNKLTINDYSLKSIGLKNVRIFQLDENCTLGECLNFGIEQASYNYISKMDDDDYYGPNYLTDLMNVFKYTDAQVTAKVSRFIYFEHNNTLGIFSPNYENKYVYNNIAGGTLTFKKEVFNIVRFKNTNIAEDREFCLDCHSTGLKIYSADKYNYIYMRHKDLQQHTWKQFSPVDAARIKPLLVTKNFIPFVIV